MSKKELKPEDRKIKFSITIDPIIYSKIDHLFPNKSKYIENLVLKDLIKKKEIKD